jgi:hypothetical protein
LVDGTVTAWFDLERRQLAALHRHLSGNVGYCDALHLVIPFCAWYLNALT